MDKDELLAELWPDTVVEEANLTQNISTLRKALGDNPKDHIYIATIAGRGYRFVAPVREEQDGSHRPLGCDTNPVRPIRRARRIGLYAATAIVVTTLSVVGYRTLRPSGGAPWPQTVPFVSTGIARFPAFSPDGKQVAYSWSAETADTTDLIPFFLPAFSIYVKAIGTNTERRITNSPGGDRCPTWSPDGQSIAFYRSAGRKSGFYVVSALGGPVRQIAPAPENDSWAGIDWFPDGRRVAVALAATEVERSSPGWGLHRIAIIDVETGKQEYLTRPEIVNAVRDWGPKVSPDGRLVAFIHRSGANLEAICIVGAGAESIRQVSRVTADFAGLAWTPDGRDLIYAMDDGHPRLWRTPIAGGAASPVTSGLEDPEFPAVARKGNRLAYGIWSGHVSLWRTETPVSTAGGTSSPWPLMNCTRNDTQPAYSHDGRRIAFTSNRTGPMEVWVADSEGKALVQLTHLGGKNNGSPQWSPDDSEIAFDSRVQGNTEILVVDVERHTVRPVTDHPAEDIVPTWSNDGRWIYFGSNRSGDFQVYKLPAKAAESPSNLPVQVTRGGGLNALESTDGNYLYFGKGRGKRGVWRRRLTPPREGDEEPVLNSVSGWGYWVLRPDGIFFLSGDGSKVHLNFFNSTSMRTVNVATFNHPPDDNRPMSISPDGRTVIYEQQSNFGSNIVLVENFR